VTEVVVRAATSDDVPWLNRIYNTYIVDSHVSFDTEPWTDDERAAWFADRVARGYPVVVAERDGAVIGASWSGPWRDKAAYRTTVETTVVLAAGESGAGVGSALYRRLHDDLRSAGFRTAIGVIALPNEVSIALHRRLGYREVGVLDDVGFKDGRHYSTMLMQKDLRDA
jgi:L-amino acid N-acyltransferase YncA